MRDPKLTQEALRIIQAYEDKTNALTSPEISDALLLRYVPDRLDYRLLNRTHEYVHHCKSNPYGRQNKA